MYYSSKAVVFMVDDSRVAREIERLSEDDLKFSRYVSDLVERDILSREGRLSYDEHQIVEMVGEVSVSNSQQDVSTGVVSRSRRPEYFEDQSQPSNQMVPSSNGVPSNQMVPSNQEAYLEIISKLDKLLSLGSFNASSQMQNQVNQANQVNQVNQNQINVNQPQFAPSSDVENSLAIDVQSSSVSYSQEESDVVEEIVEVKPKKKKKSKFGISGKNKSDVLNKMKSMQK